MSARSTELLGIDPAEVEKLIGEQFKGKDKLIAPNIEALNMGRDHARAEFGPIDLHVRRADAVGDRIFIEGNNAAGLGAVYGGATVAAWYPITPSTSLAEAFGKHCARYRVDPVTGKNRYAIVQAEDELASIGMVIGAAWNGARAFTATAGPGISLMQEFLGLAYFAEIPAVIFDVQRGGPSTGMPTRTQQSDILSAAYASHGDTKHVLLLPDDPHECFKFAAEAFDLADRLQTPVFVMLDLDIGMNEWLCEPLAWDEGRRFDRGKVLTAEELEAGREFGRYLDVDGDGITYRTWPGHASDQGRVLHPRHLEEPLRPLQRGGLRLRRQHAAALAQVRDGAPPLPRADPRRHARGLAHRRDLLRLDDAGDARGAGGAVGAGHPLDMMRLRAFPFPESVADFIDEHDFVFVVEQNRDAQMRTLLVNELGIDPARLVPILHYDGTPITARFIARAIGDHSRRSR